VKGIDRRLKLLGECPVDTRIRSNTNANKKALRFADFTVGMSQMRLAA